MKIYIALIGLLLIFLIGIGLKYLMFSVERFKEGPDSYVSESSKDYDIQPYKDLIPEVKKDVIEHFQNEWGKTGVKYTEQFMENTWKYPDALYVMTNKKGEFIGSAGIDHKYMTYPFISHIYVKKPYRKKGYGEKLFEVVQKHAKKVGHKKVNGWCEDDLVNYYEGLGCERSKTSNVLKPLVGFNLMSKEL